MIWLALAAVLGPDLQGGQAECDGCTPQARRLIEEISDYLDESAPDMDDAGNPFDAMDWPAPSRAGLEKAPWGPWLRVLVPGLGASLQAPALHAPWEHVEWEIFLFWNVSL